MKKVALITGASGNLGKATVKKFIEEGIFVVGTVQPNDPVIFDFPGELFEKYVVDLSIENDAEKAVNYVKANHGRIDIAVMTVGGFAQGNVAQTGSVEILKQYQLNFETTYHIARPVFQTMIVQGMGRIFLTGSRAGLDSRNALGMVAYSLGKSLVFRLAELMNEEAIGTNVVTAVIVPSTIDTPANRKAMPDTNFNNWVKADEIAEVIFFHSSQAANALREPLIKVYNNA